MFRNYDGSQDEGGRFGEQSIEATTSDYDKVAVYASSRASDGKITVMLINKTQDSMETPVDVDNANSAEVYVYGEGDRTQIRQLGDVAAEDGTMNVVLEPQSITILEIDVDPVDSPEVTDVSISDGQQQRSNLTSLDVSFDSVVNFANNDPLSTFSLNRTEGGAVDLVVQNIDNTQGFTLVTLGFAGSLTRAGTGALTDGNYQLSVDGSQFFDATTNRQGEDFLFGDNDVRDDLFYSLFGDSDGNRTVNVFDLLDFRTAYRMQQGDSSFETGFDYSGDGFVNVFDLLEFRKRYRSSI